MPARGTLARGRAKAPRDAVHATAVSAPITAFARIPRAWQLALFFGLSTSGYASLVAWLPAFDR
ncbi:hypothetical protein NO135_26505, partial [Clostridioides difficile]|nr:hypothetical protein [Clostridioides difficile]